MCFSVEIHAPRHKVWKTLWTEESFRDWESIIDEGTHMVGDLKEGNEVQFISSVSGYGVTSLIEKLIPDEFVSFKQVADTKNGGAQKREREWTGGKETYLLTENDGVTALVVELDVPDSLVETFKVRFPKALKRVKILTETIK